MKFYLQLIAIWCIIGAIAGGLEGLFIGLIHAIIIIAAIIIVGLVCLCGYTIKESFEKK